MREKSAILVSITIKCNFKKSRLVYVKYLVGLDGIPGNITRMKKKFKWIKTVFCLKSTLLDYLLNNITEDVCTRLQTVFN